MSLTVGQQLCVDTTDVPLVVAAGAGSGKTFTLTKRIVTALEKGVVNDIDEVCAITFTKKAAAELKSRIKGELRACNRADQALKVDEAWVSTIHGMCARILRAHALELGIDPSFKVVEGSQAGDYLVRAVDAVVERARSRDASGRVDALFSEYHVRSTGGYGTSVEGMLVSLVGIASAHVNGINSFVLPGVTAEPNAIVDQCVDVVGGVFEAASLQRGSAKRDEWIATTDSLLQAAREALQGGVESYVEAYALVSPFKLAKTFGSKGFRAHVDEARVMLGALLMEARLGAARPHLETLVALAGEALDEFARMKRDDGVMDNNDLLVLASRAIGEHPDIAARYADKFKLVMVDEFQDTDQMQVDMIKRLSGEGGRRLCTVGDAQQSIYRFRGADVSVYRRHLESVRAVEEGVVVSLSANFRSHSDVLSFVDCVFEKPGMFGGEFMSLSAGRDDSRVTVPFRSKRPRIEVLHTTNSSGGASSKRVTAAAARRIARSFAELVEAGHSAGDMVVLLGGMPNAGVYAQALRDEGLACVISGGSVFAETPEAGVVRDLVHVIANPQETQPLFNVLMSPLFGCSADDLLSCADGEGRVSCSSFWRAVPVAGDRPQGACFSPQLACALGVMGKAREMAGDVPVSRIVEMVVTESGWLSRLEREGAEGLSSAGNVFKAVRLISDIEREGALGPTSVMRGFDDHLEGSKEAPGALSVSGGNSVRIMTIHASKGLEFPIVAVAEMKNLSAPRAKLLASAVAGKVYVSLDSDASLGQGNDSVDYEALSEYVLGPATGEDELASAIAEDAGALHRRLALRGYLAVGDEEEAKRLLYVALTRAKEALVVSTKGKRTKDNPAGIPKSAFAGIFEALDPGGETFVGGVTHADYGGSQPAVVECVPLERDDEEDEAGESGASGDGESATSTSEAIAAGDGESATSTSDAVAAGDGESFPVPLPEPDVPASREPYRALREGVFSYSSISEASHEGDVLDRLASAYAVSADGAFDDARAVSDFAGAAPSQEHGGEQALQGSGSADVPPGGSGAPALRDSRAAENTFSVSIGEQDGEAGSVGFAQAADEDRATDLGTAFHRLAQYAVVTRGVHALLQMPPEERIEALSRTCNLAHAQRARLSEALDRWFGCELARFMGAMEHLDAEVPFFVSLAGPDGANVYLEGEIDLLGFDSEYAHAQVVDYKTGGNAQEGEDDLKRKHVLQAACYAYAILLQGAQSVDAAFVRVERGRADDAAQPQCVRYRFVAGDLPALEAAITRVYAHMQPK